MTDGNAMPAAWNEVEFACGPIKPRPIIKLQRSRKSNCWLATFWTVDGMPDGVAVPLPYTMQAGTFIVVSDMEARFPDAAIYASWND